MPSPREAAYLDTDQLRAAFLVNELFAPSELRLLVTDMDRIVLGGAMPGDTLPLPGCPEFGTSYFTERRELGIVNLGEPGHVSVGQETYSLDTHDFLYIGAGNVSVAFASCRSSKPLFYFLSCPAHRNLPALRIGRKDAASQVIGDAENASRRRLAQYIHPKSVATCQIVMGLTQLEPGSVWNTMPPHTHSRRSEVYLYTGLGDAVAVHLMGEPHQTRHLVVRENEAVLSPSWSVHCGAGTKPYSFVWGMAGENQSFTDMDPVRLDQLR